jgi:hypothetical protein
VHPAGRNQGSGEVINTAMTDRSVDRRRGQGLAWEALEVRQARRASKRKARDRLHRSAGFASASLNRELDLPAVKDALCPFSPILSALSNHPVLRESFVCR